MPDRRVVWAVASPGDVAHWVESIERSLQDREPLYRWWAGTDVGLSAAAIFAVLAPQAILAREVMDYSRGATPGDAGDFGRCKRLLARFPEWKDRLRRVAAEYPDGHWPRIISNWDMLAAASDDRVNEFLRAL